jgi:hypothetical protein
VYTVFPKDKEFRAFEMLEKIGFSSKPRRCAAGRTSPAAGVNEQNLASIFDLALGRYGLGLGF